ncbi:MAG: metal ABC transporter permease [Thermoleophilaceae bacterium]|nr:metal ABC transporter permease [Thermoleophilaceae bacterium]
MDFFGRLLELDFMRVALLEGMLLSVLAGLLGTQVVLRRLAFFAHGVGAAAFPGLVLADPAGVSPQVAALATGTLFAGGVRGLDRRLARVGTDGVTALLLVAALAIGIVLASDVLGSGAAVDQLLFGTLVGLSSVDLLATAMVCVAAILGQQACGRAWLVAGFDGRGAGSPELGSRSSEQVLLVLIALAVIVSIKAVGALLVAALLVVPAATARLFTSSVRSLRRATFAISSVEAIGGTVLAYALDVPPGPAIATLASGCFLVAVLVSIGRSA